MIVQELQKVLEELLKTLGVREPNTAFDHPENPANGDLSTNVAMVYAKELGMKPRDLAEKIVQGSSPLGRLGGAVRIEIAGSGFINFFFSKEYFQKNIQEILEKGSEFGKSKRYAGKNILVEHSSPNLFKAFHIGHVMNNAIGESIVRLAHFSGADVTAVSYPSDVSLGIGKAVWALLQDGGIEKLKSIPDGAAQIEYLGDCYVRGTKAYEDTPDIQPAIREITKKIYEKIKSVEYETYLFAKEKNMAYFESITKTLGSAFDAFIFESEAGVEGKKIVEEHVGNIFAKSDGAIIYNGEKEGLHTRVFINSEGYPTYEAKDLGLLSIKFAKYNPDLSIFITDHEQQEYFKVVASAAGKIHKEWKEKTIHRTHGRMSFKGAKMSSRLGGITPAQTLLDMLAEKTTDMSIAVAALKFPILRAMAGKNINFDPDTSLSFEGDTGPYLQYSTVRANAVLQKANDANITPDHALAHTWETTALERELSIFPEIVSRAIQMWEPHHVAGYLLELAQAFNSWYATTKIVDANDNASPYKLALTKAFHTVMQNGLYLLGIAIPEKM